MSMKWPESSDGTTRTQKRGGQAAPDATTVGKKPKEENSSDATLGTAETTGLPWVTMSRLAFLEESIFWTDSVNRRVSSRGSGFPSSRHPAT